MRSLRYCAIIIAAGLIIYLAVIWPQQKNYYARHVNINGKYLINPIAINDFELKDTDGKSLNKNHLKDHWTFLFFGFTHCNMVCPTALGALDKTYRSLQAKLANKQLPKIIFVSIDPDQDTVDSIKKYVTNFNPDFIGAVTTQENISAIKRIFHVDTKTTVTKNFKSINHSPEILLINPRAEIQAYFAYPPDAEQMAKDYYSIINKEE